MYSRRDETVSFKGELTHSWECGSVDTNTCCESMRTSFKFLTAENVGHGQEQDSNLVMEEMERGGLLELDGCLVLNSARDPVSRN